MSAPPGRLSPCSKPGISGVYMLLSSVPEGALRCALHRLFQPYAVPFRMSGQPSALLSLSLQAHQFLQHLIRCGYDAAVGLETPLRDDHFSELLRQVHVGHLQGAWVQCAGTAGTGLYGLEFAGVGSRDVHVVADLLQTGLVLEVRERYQAGRLLLPGVIDAGEHAVGTDTERHEAS